MLIYLAIMLAVVVLVGASCNVISAGVGTGVLPAFPGSDWFFLVKNYVGDLILWLAVLAIVCIILLVLRERSLRERLRRVQPRRQPIADPRICAILIAYNEEESIGPVISDFRSQPYVERVIVVDNNCSDQTAARALAAGASVVQEPNQGYGYACIRGLRAALEVTDASVVLLAEGDGTFSGHDIGKMIPFLEEADFVVGNRVTPGLVDTRSQMDSFFVWGNQLGAKLLQLRFWDWRFLGQVRLGDLGCTMRALRREALEEIIDDLVVGGDHFSPHMLMTAIRHGQTVVEIPITFWPRVGVSKGASRNLVRATGVGLAMLWHIMTYRPNGRRKHAETTANEKVA
jgi:cellulose synthase/poly-beta-1,6-N-acetylglucosamine synthase-like glycosyltransferase